MSREGCNPSEINNESTYEKNIGSVVASPVYTNQNGEFTIDQIPLIEEEYAKSLIENLDTNAYEVLLRKYGSETVNDTVNTLNAFVRDTAISAETYPLLADRLTLAQPITPLEMAQMMDDYLYTPSSLKNATNTDKDKLLRALNSFYNGSWIASIMGGFCGTIGNIFGTAMAMFDMIGRIGDGIQSALAAINKLKNLKDPLKAAFEKIKVKALIEKIKEKIVDAIKETWKKVKDSVENFSLENLFNEFENQVKETSASVKNKIRAEIAKAEEILKDENRDTFLKKVEGLIDYAVERFANPSLKAVELLVYRMCGFATSIEELIGRVKEALESFKNDTKESEEQVKAASAQATAEAVKSGGIRMDDETRRDGINRTKEACRQASVDAAEEADQNGEEPPIVTPTPPTNAEIDGIPTWDDLTNGVVNNLYINKGDNIYTRMGSDAWSDRYIKVETKTKLIRLAQEWGRPLRIISAYRSPAYNKGVGGARYSLHMKGVAFDLSDPSFTSLQKQFEFVELARKHGWHAAGFYPDSSPPFVHVDVGGIVPGYQSKRPRGVFVTWPRKTRATYESWRRNK